MIILVFHIKFPRGCDESHIDYEESERANDELLSTSLEKFSNLLNNNEKYIKIHHKYVALLNEVLDVEY